MSPNSRQLIERLFDRIIGDQPKIARKRKTERFCLP
jgi:hypothetical protein